MAPGGLGRALCDAASLLKSAAARGRGLGSKGAARLEHRDAQVAARRMHVACQVVLANAGAALALEDLAQALDEEEVATCVREGSPEEGAAFAHLVVEVAALSGAAPSQLVDLAVERVLPRLVDADASAVVGTVASAVAASSLEEQARCLSVALAAAQAAGPGTPVATCVDLCAAIARHCTEQVAASNAAKDALDLCVTWLADSSRLDRAQAALDVLLPALCERLHGVFKGHEFAQIFSRGIGALAADGAIVWQALAVGLFAATIESTDLQQKLLVPILEANRELIWDAIKRDLIAADFRVRKRAMFLLQAFLALRKCADARWNALCDVLGALDLAEVHHTKDIWGRMEVLMTRCASRDALVPELDMDWVGLVYVKAFRHTNVAVRKVPIRNLLEDWPRYTDDAHRYLRIPPRFVLDVLLDGFNDRSMYRVHIEEDRTGVTRSLFQLSERLPGLLNTWVADLAARLPRQDVHEVLCAIVDKIAKIDFGSNVSYSSALFEALCGPLGSVGPWLGSAQVEALLCVASSLSWTLNCAELCRLSHLTSKRMCYTVIAHGIAGELSLRALCRLFAAGRMRLWPELFARASAWVCGSPTLRAQAVCALTAALEQDSCEVVKGQASGAEADGELNLAFRPDLDCFAWALLSSDKAALREALGLLAAVASTVFSHAYMNPARRRRAALLLQVLVLEWRPYNETFREAIDQAVFTKDAIDQCRLWCEQATQDPLNLCERYMDGAFSPRAFMLANVDIDGVKEAPFALAAAAAAGFAAPPDSDIFAGLVTPLWDAAVSTLEDTPEATVPCAAALVVLDAFSPAWATRCDHGPAKRDRAVAALSRFSVKAAVSAAPPGYSVSQLFRDMEEKRWAVLAAILSAPLELAQSTQLAVVDAALDGFDVCPRDVMLTVFDTLRAALGSREDTLERIDWVAVWQACLSAFNGIERKATDSYLALVRTALPAWLLRRPKESAQGATARRIWHHIRDNDNILGFGHLALAKHCALEVLAKDPVAALAWQGELLDLVEYAASRKTLDLPDTQTDELCRVLETPFDEVCGQRVHPLSFVRLAAFSALDAVHDRAASDAAWAVDFTVPLAGALLDRVDRVKLKEKKTPIHSRESYSMAHDWAFLCILCGKLSRNPAPELDEAATALVDRLASGYLRGIFLHVHRDAIEHALVVLLLSPRAALCHRVLDLLPQLFDDRRTVLTSFVLVMALLAEEAAAGSRIAWTEPERVGLLDRLGAEALPLVTNADLVIRSVSTFIVQRTSRALLDLGSGFSPPLETTAKVMELTLEITHANGMDLSALFAKEDVWSCTSLEAALQEPVNAYGEPLISTLAMRVGTELDHYLLERFDKVRRATRRRNEQPSDFKSVAEREAKKIFAQGTQAGNSTEDAVSADAALNRQQKFDPWTTWATFLTTLDPLQQTTTSRSRETFRGKQGRLQHLVVVTSLLDDLASVAALTRTSEIFAARTVVVEDLKLTQDEMFEQIAVSSDNWLDFTAVSRAGLPSFLDECRADGYRVVGLEQGVAEATDLGQYTFQADGRVVLVCSNESQGLPVPVLQHCDDLIRLPAQGVTRTLLAHIFGAVAVWEYTKQQRFPAVATSGA